MAKISFPVLSSWGRMSKSIENALWKSLGSRCAKSRLSVMMRTPSAVKLLPNSRTPKHSATAQQFFVKGARQTSAFALAENEIATFLSPLSYQSLTSGSMRMPEFSNTISDTCRRSVCTSAAVALPRFTTKPACFSEMAASPTR